VSSLLAEFAQYTTAPSVSLYTYNNSRSRLRVYSGTVINTLVNIGFFTLRNK
jgi:hypothetical protein